jgi:hexokinase
MNQIPTYVTSIPNGTEKARAPTFNRWVLTLQGLYMAVDLGGTNFRVCSIQLNGNSTFTLTQSKVKIPADLMVAKTAPELFSFLAEQIRAFLQEHHNEHYVGYVRRRREAADVTEEEVFSLGFTFSFPVRQVGINKGYLMRWTKGFDIKDAIGKDVCALLQEQIDARHLPVRVAALVNDTVGTLMARSYGSPGKTGTLIGAIFGTGTNGAYVERLPRIAKLAGAEGEAFDRSTGLMIINTEWGSFDNALRTLPDTAYDRALDVATPNPGIQMFEKRISGMYLGELLRLALQALVRNPAMPLFKDDGAWRELHTNTVVNPNAKVFAPWGLDSAFLSTAVADASAGLQITRQAIERDLGIDSPSVEDARVVQAMAAAVGRRAARLSAVAIAAIVIASEQLEKHGETPEDDIVDVGVDGSLVEFYPGFEDMMREAYVSCWRSRDDMLK